MEMYILQLKPKIPGDKKLNHLFDIFDLSMEIISKVARKNN